jgi:hypothetical protein
VDCSAGGGVGDGGRSATTVERHKHASDRHFALVPEMSTALAVPAADGVPTIPNEVIRCDAAEADNNVGDGRGAAPNRV